MGAGEIYFGRHLPLVGFQPARRTQAPTIARLKPGKPKFRHRRAEVIAKKTGILQKFFRDRNAHGVGAHILVIGVATTVAKKTCHRILAARKQRLVENIEGFIYFDFCHGVISESWAGDRIARLQQ